MKIHPLYHIYWLWSGADFRVGRKVTKAGALMMAATVTTGVLALDTDFSLAYQALPLLGGITAIALIWSFCSRSRWQAHRFLPRYGTVDQELVYRVELQNQSASPQCDVMLWEDFNDPRPSLDQFLTVPEPGEEKRNGFDRWFGFYRWKWLIGYNRNAQPLPCSLPPIDAGQSLTISPSLIPRRRGRLQFNACTAGWPEPFGLFRSLRRLPERQSVLILPKRYALPPLPLPGLRQYQPGGVALAMAVGQSEEFVGVRDYRPGDPLRHIHWRSSARAGKPIVKEFQDEYMVRHAIILDTFHEAGPDEIFEEAVSLAASFACTIPDEDSLMDLLFVKNRAYCFTSGRGLAHPEQVLEILATLEPSAPSSFALLEELVLLHARFLSGCVLIFTSWDSQRLRLTRKLQAAGVAVEIFVILAPGKENDSDSNPLPDLATHLPKSAHVLRAGNLQEELQRL